MKWPFFQRPFCLSVLLTLSQCCKRTWKSINIRYRHLWVRGIFLCYCKVWSLQVTNNLSVWEQIISSVGNKYTMRRATSMHFPFLGSISSTQARLGDVVVGCACFWKPWTGCTKPSPPPSFTLPLLWLSASLPLLLLFSCTLQEENNNKKNLPLQHVSQPLLKQNNSLSFLETACLTRLTDCSSKPSRYVENWTQNHESCP